MKRMVVGLVIVMLFCHTAWAAKTIISEFDGVEWTSWKEEKKFNFLK